MKNSHPVLAAVILSALLSSFAFAELDTTWARRFDGGGLDEDWAADMAVDPAGNVYVLGTGYTGGLFTDIILQKYSSAGERLWTAVHNGAQNNDDSAAAMTIDPNGNVYVCGWSFHQSGRGMGMVTIKYGPDGDSAWLACYDHVGDFDDAALDICLDGAGRVVVTGFVTDSFWNLNYCTIAHDTATGGTAWMGFYDRTPEEDEDVAIAICSDGAGAIYITGYSYDDGTDYDITTIRYRPDGTRHWTRRKNYYPWVYDDYGTDIVWDPVTSTVIVGGYVYDDNRDYEYFTMKYNPVGDSVWARAYNRYPANDEDLLLAMTADAAGNIIVTGTSIDDSTDYDVTTVRYTPDGVQQWVSRHDYDGYEDGGVHVRVDSLGQAFVVGYGDHLMNDYDLLTVKLDTLGNTFAAVGYDNAPTSLEEWGCRVLPQPDGHIYVLGTSEDDASDYDIVLLKYRELLHDIGVVRALAPESLNVADSLALPVVLRNWALNADSCWLRLSIGWADEHFDSLWVSLPAGATDTVEFAAWHPDRIGTALLRLRLELRGDERPWNDTASARILVWGDTTGLAGQEPLVPREFGMALGQNPVRDRALLRLALPGAGPAKLRMYDVAGSLVLPEQRFMARTGGAVAAVQLDTRPLPAGVYFLKLSQDGQEVGRKLVVQR
ncbi:SBBP repeat-containing protein [candidate division WOR-3 bacterium]|nr:SBBP repeat-containing protein [candidate division WOR-3 bacterium]